MYRRPAAHLLAVIVLAAVSIGPNEAVAAGPNPRFVTHGPWGGDIGAVEVNPTDSRTAFATADGLWKSEDGGRTWRDVLDDPDLLAIATAPSDPAIVYTGGYKSFGRSDDGGRSWSDRSEGLGTVGDIAVTAVDPTDADHVYVGKEDGQSYRSEDGGLTWIPMLPDTQNVFQIAIAPSDPNILFAATPYGIEKSTDGGLTWERAEHILRVTDVAVDPVDSAIVYAIDDKGVYRSDDGAQTWSLVGAELSENATAIAIDPNDPSVLYVALSLDGVAKSTDHGETWQRLLVDGDVRDVAVGSATGTVIAATSFGVYRSDDAGETWRLSSEGIAQVGVDQIQFAPSDPSRVYVAGGLRMGVYRSQDGDRTWEAARHGLPTADVLDLAVAPDDPNTVLVATYGYPEPWGVFRTNDGGEHWEPAGVGIDGTVLESVAFDPSDGTIAYALDYWNGLYVTIDGGISWTPMPSPNIEYGFRDIGLDPTDHRRLYVSSDSGLYRSLDQGATWSNLLQDDFSDSTVDPTNPSSIYAFGEFHLYHSADDGATWELLRSGLEHVRMTSFAMDPSSPSILYVGSDPFYGFDPGVFRSVDGGATFRPFSRGLPETAAVHAVSVNPAEHHQVLAGLYDGVVGGSVYQLETP